MRQAAVVCLTAVLAIGWTGSPATAQGADPSRGEPAPGGTSPETVLSITEEEFLEPLLASSSPAVLALAEELGARRADAVSTRAFEAPELSATREDLGRGGVETEIGASWRPPRPDRRRLEVATASERLRATEASFEAALLERRLELRRVYADWAVADRRARLGESEPALLRELTRRSEERARVGEASGLELRRLRLAQADADARLAVARSELATARSRALAWRPDLAGPSLAPALPEPTPEPGTDPPPTPAAITTLEAELRAAELETELARKVAEMPELFVGWKQIESENPSLADPELTDGNALGDPNGLVIGLSWPIPLPGKGRAKQIRADARRDAVAAELELQRRRFEAEVRGLRDAYESVRRASDDARKALADAEPAVTAARAAFRLGEGDLTTLLDTLRNATDARLSALDLWSRALHLQRELERIRGHALAAPAPSTRSTNP